MRLKYKILWIENEIDWMESVEDDLKTIITTDYSFKYEMTNCTKEESDINYNEYDLILMDLNLDGEPTGDRLIQKIRENGVYTDVVFYSSGGLDTIKEKARELGLEGVYFSGRNNVEFIKKVKKVIETTIKKVQDLSNLRGLVMSEVSELDSMMEEIILSYYNSEERMTRFHKHITANREKSMKRSLSHPDPNKCDKLCELSWRSSNILDYIKVLDSSQKAHAIHEMLNDVNADGHLGFVDGKFFDTYNAEIISVRNNLAHCESFITDGQEVLKTRKGDVTFSENDFKAIRENITKYNELFKALFAI